MSWRDGRETNKVDMHSHEFRSDWKLCGLDDTVRLMAGRYLDMGVFTSTQHALFTTDRWESIVDLGGSGSSCRVRAVAGQHTATCGAGARRALRGGDVGQSPEFHDPDVRPANK